MLGRITTILAAAFATFVALVGSAWALPGEGYGVDPYGIPMTDAPPPTAPVLETVSGWVLEPALLVITLVVLAAVMAAIGYWTGSFHQRRVALH